MTMRQAPPPTQLSSFAPAEAAKKLTKSQRVAEREETAGAAWGHMKAPQMTTELKRELLMVKMRGVLDPKRFYRSSDSGKGLPKHFQIGTIVDGAEDGHANRLSKKERKGSIMQEVMSDSAIRKRAKSQFLKSQAEHMEGRKIRKKSKPGGPGSKQKRR